MQYIRTFFENLTIESTEPPTEASVELCPKYDDGFEQFKKTPVLLSVKDNKKKVLSYCHLNPEHEIDYDNEPNFAVFTGKVNNIILVDFDVNKKTNFNTSKLDGVEWFEKEFGPIAELFGLVTETPTGGIHAYCIYTDDLPDTAVGLAYRIKTKEVKVDDQILEEKYEEESVAIDILSNGGVGFQGRHYNIIKNTELKEMPKHFLEFLKTLEYVPHSSCINSYGGIYTLTSNKDFKRIELIPGLEDLINITTDASKITFFDLGCSDPEIRRKAKMGLLLTDDYRNYLSQFDDKIIDYVLENAEKMIGSLRSGKPWYRDIVKECVYKPIVKYSEQHNDYSLKLKLPFKDGFPLFTVFNKDGTSLDWIKHKHLDQPPVFDLSWKTNKVKVKAKCEGLWSINKGVYCTFHVKEIHLVE